MGKILRINKKDLSEILSEGLQLIEHDVMTGFNFDEKAPTTHLTLAVQYYHNVEEHIGKFLELMERLCREEFKHPITHTTAKKWGLFKWKETFADEPGNRYYAVHTCPHSLESISFNEVQQRIKNELIVAKDRCYFITFIAENGVQSRFLIDKIKKHATKYLMAESRVNPDRVDDYSWVKPLFMLRDDFDQVADKSDLELVYRLQLPKGKRIIWSLIQAEKLEDSLQKARQFPCGASLECEKRYVDKDFFKDY